MTPRYAGVSAVILIGLLVAATHPCLTHAQEPGDFPEITSEGKRWAKRVVGNARRMMKGKEVRRPPFVDPDVANAIVQIERFRTEAARVARGSKSLEALVESDEFRGLVELAEQEASAVTSLSLGRERFLIEALNDQVTTYPPPAASALWAAAEQLSTLTDATAVTGYTGNTPERKSDGVHLTGEHWTNGSTDQIASIDVVNGIATELPEGIRDAVILAATCGRKVGHIHNQSGSFMGDVFQSMENFKKRGRSRVVEVVKEKLLENARACNPYVLLCHSQGAAICAHAASQAFEEAPELREKLRRCVQVVGLGGFTLDSKFPADLESNVTLVEHGLDPVPGLARGVPPSLPPVQFARFVKALVQVAWGGLGEHDLLRYTETLCRTTGGGPSILEQAEANFQACLCGNGTVDSEEECDDGNTENGDGCDGQCRVEEKCGNGILEPDGADGIPGTADDEQCDGGEGCDENCQETSCGTPSAQCLPTGDPRELIDICCGDNCRFLEEGTTFFVPNFGNIATCEAGGAVRYGPRPAKHSVCYPGPNFIISWQLVGNRDCTPCVEHAPTEGPCIPGDGSAGIACGVNQFGGVYARCDTLGRCCESNAVPGGCFDQCPKRVFPIEQ